MAIGDASCPQLSSSWEGGTQEEHTRGVHEKKYRPTMDGEGYRGRGIVDVYRGRHREVQMKGTWGL